MHGTADPDYWGSNPHLPLYMNRLIIIPEIQTNLAE